MQVSGPLGEVFGRDPVEFVLHLCASFSGDLVTLTKRVAQRTGNKEWSVSRDGVRSTLPLVASSRDPKVVARALVATALKSPGVLVDEASRQGMGLPVGPRSLDGGPDDAFAKQLGPQWGAPEAGELFTIIAILTIAIPLICTLAPIVLPPIMALFAGAATPVETPEAKTERERAAAADASPLTGILPEDLTSPTGLALLAAVGLGIFLIVRKFA